MPPKGPAEKRVRIGLTLAPDVAKTLSEYGRCEFLISLTSDVNCAVCDQPFPHERHSKKRPTRTEIIERGVRLTGALPGNAFEALDKIMRGLACGPMKAVELALHAYADWSDTGAVPRPHVSPEAEQQVKADRAEGIRTSRKRVQEGDRVKRIGPGFEMAVAGTVCMIDRKVSPHSIAVKWDSESGLSWYERYALIVIDPDTGEAEIESVKAGLPRRLGPPPEGGRTVPAGARPVVLADTQNPKFDYVTKPCPRHSPKYCEPDCKYRVQL